MHPASTPRPSLTNSPENDGHKYVTTPPARWLCSPPHLSPPPPPSSQVPNPATPKMKLIITGATGLVATELLRQSLRTCEITSVVALARKPVSAPSDVSPADAAKLQSVVLDDYERYPDDVRAQLAGADACIWSVDYYPGCCGGY